MQFFDDRLSRAGRQGSVFFAIIPVFLGVLLQSAPSFGGPSLQEQILENKYQRGDYAVFIGWHDPKGEQFDTFGSFAVPFGVKVRLRFGGRFRAEGEFSYYRRGGDPQPALSVVASPLFDSLNLFATFQVMLLRSGWFQPYVGGGPAFVSVSNDFFVQILAVPEDLIDRFAFASWSEFDLGVQGVAGIDVRLGSRVFPYVEYRHLLGKFDYELIRIGNFGFEPEELADLDGDPIPGGHDWSGPMVTAGLKVLF